MNSRDFLAMSDAESINVIANLNGKYRFCECEHPHAYVERAEIRKSAIIMTIGGRQRPLQCHVIWRCLKCGGEIYNPKALNNGDHRDGFILHHREE